ncbi:ankyrin repeat domain-containing protein [Planctomycetes bacterium K23_9]|uniref:Ankyrin repeat protein n=1 Tax=Stieleria marina TaxID=1930275 RepID=A0A517NUN4_9BACT|nr:Ankyrin repeat protein [Planctomycetes bacterium K23_9]
MIHAKQLIQRVVLIVLPALLFAASARADMAANTDPTPSLYQRLCQLNPYWSDETPDFTVIANVGDLDDEVSLIQSHFALVIQRLKSADVEHLSESQREQRIDKIQRLHDYMTNGMFPKNTFVAGRRPVFIDPWGTHCAVGHLIATSGHQELANLINHQHRLDVLADIKTEGLVEWQIASGLTMNELALIQPHYAFRLFSQTIKYPSEIESLILGDSAAVMQALKTGKLTVESRCGGKTLLHFAAAGGDLELVKHLIEQGADLNAVSTLGCDETAIAKGGKHADFEVRWDAPTLVTKGRYSTLLGPVYKTVVGSFVADVLQDLYGGIDGKNALEYATATPRSPKNRVPLYRAGRVGYGLGDSANELLESLTQGRADVAQWLQQQGLK